ncbi:hypothetical protein NMG60_11016807 [Bertholletia excelsa]
MFGRHWSSRLSPFTPSPPGHGLRGNCIGLCFGELCCFVSDFDGWCCNVGIVEASMPFALILARSCFFIHAHRKIFCNLKFFVLSTYPCTVN